MSFSPIDNANFRLEWEWKEFFSVCGASERKMIQLSMLNFSVCTTKPLESHLERLLRFPNRIFKLLTVGLEIFAGMLLLVVGCMAVYLSKIQRKKL